MIEFDKSVEIVMSHIRTTGYEEVNFLDSLGRILGEDIYSDVDMPPFNKSAVDGYACRRTDMAEPLIVLEVIPAGKAPKKASDERDLLKNNDRSRTAPGSRLYIYG